MIPVWLGFTQKRAIDQQLAMDQPKDADALRLVRFLALHLLPLSASGKSPIRNRNCTSPV